MSTIERVRRTTIGSETWEPCITSDGRTIGEAEWLRRRTDEGWSHTAMLWRCDPMTFDYDFPGDESFLIVAGAVQIELTDERETIDLRPLLAPVTIATLPLRLRILAATSASWTDVVDDPRR